MSSKKMFSKQSTFSSNHLSNSIIKFYFYNLFSIRNLGCHYTKVNLLFRWNVHPFAKLSGSRMALLQTRTMSVTPSPTEKGLPTMPRTISSPSIPLYISILTNGLEENLIGLLTMLTIPVRADHGRCLHSKLTELPALHTLGLNVSRILTMYIQQIQII